MSTTKATRTNKNNLPIETRPVAKLRPHPRQHELFGTPSADVVEAMAQSIKSEGLMHALEILPDGTVVCGHTRLAAVKKLRWKDVACIVLHELAAQGDEAIVQYLVRDNVERRQMTKLQRARVTLMLEGRTANQIRKHGLSEEDRNRVGILLQMSGRNLSRWVRVLSTPIEVQNAVDRGELTLGQAGQVGHLRQEDQETIAWAIREGTPPADAVADFVEARKPNGSANAAFRRYVQASREALKQLRNRVRDVAPHLAHEHLRTLQQAAALLSALTQRGSPEEVAKVDEALSKLLQEVSPGVN